MNAKKIKRHYVYFFKVVNSNVCLNFLADLEKQVILITFSWQRLGQHLQILVDERIEEFIKETEGIEVISVTKGAKFV